MSRVKDIIIFVVIALFKQNSYQNIKGKKKETTRIENILLSGSDKN